MGHPGTDRGHQCRGYLFCAWSRYDLCHKQHGELDLTDSPHQRRPGRNTVWSRQITWPEYWPLIGGQTTHSTKLSREHWPLCGGLYSASLRLEAIKRSVKTCVDFFQTALRWRLRALDKFSSDKQTNEHSNVRTKTSISWAPDGAKKYELDGEGDYSLCVGVYMNGE